TAAGPAAAIGDDGHGQARAAKASLLHGRASSRGRALAVTVQGGESTKLLVLAFLLRGSMPWRPGRLRIALVGFCRTSLPAPRSPSAVSSSPAPSTCSGSRSPPPIARPSSVPCSRSWHKRAGKLCAPTRGAAAAPAAKLPRQLEDFLDVGNGLDRPRVDLHG